jgi:hypothetical protein
MSMLLSNGPRALPFDTANRLGQTDSAMTGHVQSDFPSPLPLLAGETGMFVVTIIMLPR